MSISGCHDLVVRGRGFQHYQTVRIENAHKTQEFQLQVLLFFLPSTYTLHSLCCLTPRFRIRGISKLSLPKFGQASLFPRAAPFQCTTNQLASNRHRDTPASHAHSILPNKDRSPSSPFQYTPGTMRDLTIFLYFSQSAPYLRAHFSSSRRSRWMSSTAK